LDAVLVYCKSLTKSWLNLFSLVAHKTTRQVAAMWHTKFIVIQTIFWAIAKKDWKMGVLHCSSWTVLNAIRFNVPPS